MDDVEKLQPFLFLQPDTLANVRTRCRGSDIPSPDLDKWRENPNLRPQQFSSSSLHPKLNDLLKYKSGFAGEVPDSPMFPHIFDTDVDEDLKFVPDEDDGDIEDVLRQPPIGLESNVQYNDHELPSQLSPDQYFKLEWANSQDRQELRHSKEPVK